MGESKRKAMRAAVDAAVKQALAAVSLECVCDGPAIQFLLLAEDRAEEARARLGGLPNRVERALRLLSEQTGHKGGGCVGWWRSPEGREYTILIRDPKDSDAHMEWMGLTSLIRGYGLRFANFHSEGAVAAWRRMCDDLEAHLRQSRDDMVKGPPVSVDVDENGFIQLIVPGPQDEKEWWRLAVDLVRHLDRLVATPEAFEKSYGRVAVVFDGFDDDPREVMDIEQCQAIIRLTQTAVSHWRWILHPEHLISWTGAAYATTSASIDETNRVSFAVDEAEAMADFKREVTETTVVAEDLGLLSSQRFLARMEEISGLFSKSLRLMAERQESLKNGHTKLRQEDPMGVPGSDVRGLASQIQLQAMPFMLDRSMSGLGMRRIIMDSQKEFPTEEIKTAVESWYTGRSELALIRRDDGPGMKWVLDELPNEDATIEEALDRLLQGAVKQGEPLLNQWFVAKSLRERLQDLASRCISRIVASPPEDWTALTSGPAGMAWNVEADAGAAAAAGLLDLAVDPGAKEIDFGMVQITNSEEFTKITSLQLAVMAELSDGAREEGLTSDEFEQRAHTALRAWARDDGTLIVRGIGRLPHEVVVRAGCWRVLEKAEYEQLSRQVGERLEAVGLEGLLDFLGSAVQRTIEDRIKAAELFHKQAAVTTAVTLLFGRSQESLLKLQSGFGEVGQIREVVDGWLGGTGEFLLLWRHSDGRCVGAVMQDERMLIEEGLGYLLELGDAPASSLLLTLSTTDTDITANKWWEQRGGAVVPKYDPS